MRKIRIPYVLYSSLYFFTVICFILFIASTSGLTEKQALIIGIASLIAFIVFTLVVSYKRKNPRSRNVTSRIRQKKFLAFHNKLHFLSIPTALTILILVSGIFSYNIYKNNITAQIPDTVIEFGEKYPEATKFVNNYPKCHNKTYNMDIASEVQKGTIPLFIQWDKRWGYKKYGGDLLALSGCGPTCISMVVCGLTGNTEWNPYKVAEFSEKQGYYVDGEGTSWDLMTTGAELLGVNSSYGSVDESYIRENLTVSTPMICSMYPGDFTYSGHFIVLLDIDSQGNILVNDPNSIKNSKAHWSLEKILPQIRNIWKFQI